MKKIIIYIFFILSLHSFSQEILSKEVSLKTDNDLYTSIFRDRYYTNGIFLSYRYLSKEKTEKLFKKIYEIQIGQKLYTPKKAAVVLLSDHDRPYAGYLYAGFGFSNFYENNSILKISSQIGTLGENAFGEETIIFVHRIYGYVEPIGWKYQISNAFAFNANVSYIKSLPQISTSGVKIDWVNSLNLGSIFNNLSTGLNIRLGFKPLKEIKNSISYNGALGNKKQDHKEFFFYLKPLLYYTAYDATIQGSFSNNTSPVTYQIKPFVFTSEIGFSFVVNKLNLGYTFNIHSKKLKSADVPNINSYGTININYLF